MTQGLRDASRHGGIQEGRMNWKLMTLATTSVAALALSVSSAEAAGMMGDVTIGYGHNWSDFEAGGEFGSTGFDNEFPAILGAARVNLPYSDTVNLQLDVVGSSSLDQTFFNGKGIYSSAQTFGIGGHVNYRDDQGLLGVFAGAGRVVEFLSAPVFFAGFEGQYFCNDWTLSAKAGYMDSDESLLLSNAGFIQAGASYYSGKKLKLTGNLAYIDGQFGIYSDVDVEEWAWSLGAEYWFGETMPVSGFVEYRGRSVEGSATTGSLVGTADLDENTINAGVKFHFGGDGFQDADRKGASAELPDLNWYRLIPGTSSPF